MATMLVRQRVANFDTWKKVFDRLEDVRQQHGITGHSVHRDAIDPNMVVVVMHAGALEDAKRYGASKVLREAMKEAGVEGVPEISFLSDVEDLHAA
ncbi:MAG: hypothetical protein KDJ86_11060 [Bauldia sp.]|uniref:hypothetical protein n=1 Tax=Bauldia sp. TaxID=2575872 RepID=UPI001D810826|nr:hypothetical protein [Bauldia sp.]MCB1496318.1 hypothetical protein [Bauldia sp.]